MASVTVSELLHLSVAAYPEQVETMSEQLAELERRLAELDEAPEAGESWDTVKARILESL